MPLRLLALGAVNALLALAGAFELALSAAQVDAIQVAFNSLWLLGEGGYAAWQKRSEKK